MNKKLATGVILTALGTDIQTLANRVNEDRSLVSRILSGERQAKRVREKVADELAHQVRLFILTDEPTESASG